MSDLDIAVIGMSCRVPGANDSDAFWENLVAGIESIHRFSDDELIAAGVEPALVKHPGYVPAQGILDDIECFDAAFFGISPGEAELLDPQQRLFLEEAWKALEIAGYDPDRFQGSIAVFAGAGSSTYLYQNILPSIDASEPVMGFQATIGNDKDFLATRISYKLNLRGPSLTVQTACSTSLVAVHLACQSLLQGECDMAMAGGVAIRLPHQAGYLYQEGMILSPDGHCRAFDAQAQGTVGGSGVGIVILKRLADALADGDSIHAIIKGSAINNDGSLKVGYTAPSVSGQAEVIAEAQVVAGVSAESISYIEAHGTATVLGDPIEVRALTQAFRRDTRRTGFCALGSVKTNIGHLDTAAGIAGLIKTILALKHRQIPPSLHYNQPNPQIDFQNSPFFVNTRLADWKSPGLPRRAGVSSFGIGGTNAHVILEEAPDQTPTSASRPWQILVLSARTPAAIKQAAAHLAEHLRSQPESLPDTAFTLQVGRRQFRHRRMWLCESAGQAVDFLTEAAGSPTQSTEAPQSAPRVAFLFPGQGSQYVNMGRELYAAEPIFRDQIDQCLHLLNPLLKQDVLSLLFPPPGQEETSAAQLQQTALTQPVLFMIEYALARLWISWGIEPEAMIGHSSGEYVAACLAGVFSLEDALRLVVARGQLMQALPGGAMLAIPLSEAELLPLLAPGAALAATNGPQMSVVSGPFGAIDALGQELKRRGIETVRLRTSHAFHSPMMEPVVIDFLPLLRKVRFNPPENPWVSTVTGDWISREQATDPQYWLENILLPVRFSEAIERLLVEGNYILLETGPGRTLTTLARRHPAYIPSQIALTSLHHPQEPQSDQRFLLSTLGRLWLAGVQIDWSTFYAFETRQRITLPTYPFEKHRFWVNPVKPKITATSITRGDPADWLYTPSWKLLGPAIPANLLASSPWLVLLDELGLGRLVADRLRQTGAAVSTAQPDDHYYRLDEQNFCFDPQQPNHFYQVLNDLGNKNRAPRLILNFMDFGAPTSGEPPGATLPSSFANLLYLAQAFGRLPPDNLPYELIHIADALFSVFGDEVILPERSLAIGPLRVIPQEYPKIGCSIIDVSSARSKNSSELSRLAGQIIAELSARRPGIALALRNGRRWEQTFEQLPRQASAFQAPVLRQNGVYWITGGLGGIGLALAGFLARTYQARIVLSGHSPFPERDQWLAWLDANPAHDPISTKIRLLQSMEQVGATIQTLRTDVSDPDQMQIALGQVLARFTGLNGIIHAAGIPGGGLQGLMQSRTAEAVRLVWNPKIEGAKIISEITRNLSLDFVVYCSSLASYLGGIGQADYTAANAYLDAYAAMQRRNGIPVVSINWDSWQEVGMSARRTTHFDLSQAIRPEEGIEAFRRVLDCEADQVLVSTQPILGRLQSESSSAGRNNGEVDSPRPESQTNQAEDKQKVITTRFSSELKNNRRESTLAGIWKNLLRVEEIEPGDDFFELGGDSLLAVRLMSQVREVYGQSLPMSALLEHRTLAEFTNMVAMPKKPPKKPGPISIVSSGTGLPLFCIHPVGGNILCYADLAQEFEGERPVLGLQARGLDGEAEPLSSIPEMAAEYLSQIKTVQTSGPYLLMGWSMGGMIAFEIARQLELLDEPVRLLGMVDTPAPQDPKSATANQLDEAQMLVDFLRDLSGSPTPDLLPVSTNELRQLPIAQQHERIFAAAQQMKLLPQDFREETFFALIKVFRANAQAMLSYIPEEIRGNICLFQAQEAIEGFSNSYSAWAALTKGQLENIPIPGNHFDLIYPPHVKIFVSVLKLKM